MHYAYLFEARGIQRFLFATGKLRDMLAGSEQVDFICSEFGYLQQVLKHLGLAPRPVRQAGGVFYLVFDHADDARRFRDTWRLATAQWLPGLERVDALSEGATVREAIAAGIAALAVARNRLSADLPRPGPLAARSPRTGLAAVARKDKELVDAATRAQRSFERPDTGHSLARRFLSEAAVSWPTNFEGDAAAEKRFPLGRSRLVGVVHADGNGLGELLRALNLACANAADDTYVHLYRRFSDGLSKATHAAAEQATREVLYPARVNEVMPARPLILGGDDLSILVRADLALPFTRAFLSAFQTHTATAMQDLRQAFAEHGMDDQAEALPASLSACAGIAYVKCSHPFQAAHELAEGLCQRAKQVARQHRDGQRMPSMLAFYKVQDALLEDGDVLHARTLTACHGSQILHLGLDAYSLEPIDGVASLADLEQLVAVFAGGAINDRPLRTLATLLHSDLAESKQAYQRWREVSRRRHSDRLNAFDQQLKNLVGQPREDLPFGQTTDSRAISPISDVLTLLSLTRASNGGD